MKEFYEKYKEVINYLVFGVFLTFIVNFIIYFICRKVFHVVYMISKVISWIFSMLFAYIINRKVVFISKSDNLFNEIYQFYKYRIFSLIIELLMLCMFVELFNIDDIIANVIVTLFVIALNYVFSKLFVFKKES